MTNSQLQETAGSAPTAVPSPLHLKASNNTSVHPYDHLAIPATPPSPRRGSIAAHLMSFAARSSTSLNLLSSSAPATSSPSSSPSPSFSQQQQQQYPSNTLSPPTQHASSFNAPSIHFNEDAEKKSSVPPMRSTFTNTFRKLQSSFGKKNAPQDQMSPNPNAQSPPMTSSSTFSPGSPLLGSSSEKVMSSSSSAMSTASWRSKGAEILNKKAWGRNRKNSEPVLSSQTEKRTGPVFGSRLEDAIGISHIPDTPMVPAVLYRCAEFLEAKGIDEVGLYRVPGSHASVQRLKKIFDSGADYNLLAQEFIDPNDIATLLKLYLRELPAPLLPAVQLEQFQSLLSTDRHICHTLRGILIRLPRANFVVLSFLCHHLSRIAAYSDKTKMNVSNLGVVFAPTLSIGSVLFKALLGGFYSDKDTPENRELGLKIVWGGLLQETIDYDVATYSDDSEREETSGVQVHYPNENNTDHNRQESVDSLYPPPPLPPPQLDQDSQPKLNNEPSVTFVPKTTYTPASPIQKATQGGPDANILAAFSLGGVMATSVPGAPGSVGSSSEDEERQLMKATLMRESMAVQRKKSESKLNATLSAAELSASDHDDEGSSGSEGGYSSADQQSSTTSSTPVMPPMLNHKVSLPMILNNVNSNHPTPATTMTTTNATKLSSIPLSTTTTTTTSTFAPLSLSFELPNSPVPPLTATTVNTVTTIASPFESSSISTSTSASSLPPLDLSLTSTSGASKPFLEFSFTPFEGLGSDLGSENATANVNGNQASHPVPLNGLMIAL